MADVTCPNCGGEVGTLADLRKLVEQDDRGDVLPEADPEGGILVCLRCNLAVDPAEEGVVPESAPTQSPEHLDTAEDVNTDLDAEPADSAA
jgi:hypothetical protein